MQGGTLHLATTALRLLRQEDLEGCEQRSLESIAGAPPCQDEEPRPGQEKINATVWRLTRAPHEHCRWVFCITQRSAVSEHTRSAPRLQHDAPACNPSAT